MLRKIFAMIACLGFVGCYAEVETHEDPPRRERKKDVDVKVKVPKVDVEVDRDK